jgi:hypothetical protein
MGQVTIRRRPSLYIVGLVELLALHFVLCYPAAVCRGLPPLEPFWRVAIFLPFPGVVLLTAFDDYSFAPRLRKASLLGFCVASSIILGVATTNLSDVRPHTGHLAGYLGLVSHLWPAVVGQSTLWLVLALVFVFCLESASRRLWGQVRHFSSPTPTWICVRDLLLIVASLGLLCGIVRLIVLCNPDYFSRRLFSD